MEAKQNSGFRTSRFVRATDRRPTRLWHVLLFGACALVAFGSAAWVWRDSNCGPDAAATFTAAALLIAWSILGLRYTILEPLVREVRRLDSELSRLRQRDP